MAKDQCARGTVKICRDQRVLRGEVLAHRYQAFFDFKSLFGWGGEKGQLKALKTTHAIRRHLRVFNDVRISMGINWFSFFVCVLCVLTVYPWLAQSQAFSQQMQAAQVIVKANANGIPLQQQLEKRIHVELGFLRRAVKLTAEQDAKLNLIDAKTLDEARNAVRNQKAGGIFRRQIIINGAEAIDPLRMRSFERELTKQIDTILDEEQKKQFATEKKRREEFQHELTVSGLIMLLDKKLALSPDQKKALRESLADWTDSGSIEFDNYFMNNNYLPACPDELIVKHLSKAQAKIYENTPRLDMVGTAEQIFVPGDVKIER